MRTESHHPLQVSGSYPVPLTLDNLIPTSPSFPPSDNTPHIYSMWTRCIGGQRTTLNVILKKNSPPSLYRVSYWPGAQQVGSTGQPVSSKNPPASTSPALRFHTCATTLSLFCEF